MITGLKLLNGSMSLNGQVNYTKALRGQWQRIPGNGSYVAHDDGLWSAGTANKPHYVVMECRAEMNDILSLPHGVRCWRYVRWSRDATEEDLIPFVKKKPAFAFANADQLQQIVVSVDVWTEIAHEVPWAALVFGSKYLSNVLSEETWLELARRRPAAAGSAHEFLKIPVKTWTSPHGFSVILFDV